MPNRIGSSKVYLREIRESVVIGDVLYPPGGTFGPRTQMDFQLVIIDRGSLCLELDRETIPVPEHHAILLSPGHREHFLFSPNSETRHSWVAVAPDAVAMPTRCALERASRPIPFTGRPTALIEMLRASSPPRIAEDGLQSGFIQGLALALLCSFASAVFGERGAAGGDAVLSRLDNCISISYPQHLSLRDVARAAGVSPQQLLKLCRAAGRPTPIRQLYQKRLEAAADLLLHTGLPLSQIAEQCGFPDQFHFSRKYKQFWGESPLFWRTRSWKRE